MPGRPRCWTRSTTCSSTWAPTEEQLEFPLLYAIGREGVAMKDPGEGGENLHMLFAIIIEIPAPVVPPREPFQMLVSDLGYSDYLGRLAIGRVRNGRCEAERPLVLLNEAATRSRSG
jgi:GTP-binding protein